MAVMSTYHSKGPTHSRTLPHQHPQHRPSQHPGHGTTGETPEHCQGTPEYLPPPQIGGEHLQYIKAPIFEHHIPNDFHQSLQDAANENRLNPNELKELSYQLKSIGGQVEFKRFVSRISEKEDGDLYVTIADTIKSNVHVQTWGRQSGRSGNYESANRYHVLNVECISIDSRLWKPSHDHSKWCVSNSGDWTCIADSNRAESQFNRPGGALCINNKGVTDIFKSFIKGKSDCPYGL
ncbi:deoxyribonuclease-2-alpha-like [Sparus aurata]|uniref:deoxyribonuclease-2-alpha-like n=1 Tax=Sparus aurata TaxID=8175 RepID=UPI0011C16C7E|nr:deoxyribonuclease-2-alpha-like [Sparus aurata]